MIGVLCWHRPGALIGSTRTCRHCHVAVAECPCVSYGRVVDHDCAACGGSGFVATVRSSVAKFRELIEEPREAVA